MSIKRFLVGFILAAVLAVSALAAPPSVISESAVLIDAETGQVLYEKAMHEKHFPASITKIATVIVGLEELSLDDKIVMSDEAVFSVGRETSHIALTPGEEITVRDAAYAALLMSANDACNGIAERASGSIDAFVSLMNERAAEYGALNTHFNNANGLKDDEHYTTAYDMAMICRHAIKNGSFREIFGSITYEMEPNNKQPEKRLFANQHDMVNKTDWHYEGIVGGKAGWTTTAQYTLVTAAERDGRCLIAVVMKSPRNENKYQDTTALLDYGFSEFSEVSFSEEEILADGGLSVDGEATLLLPEGKTKGDVSISITEENGKSVVSFSLEEAPLFMPTKLLDVACSEKQAVETVSEKTREAPEEKTGGFKIFLLCIGVIVLAFVAFCLLVVLFVIIRKKIYRMRKRRRNRRKYR